MKIQSSLRDVSEQFNFVENSLIQSMICETSKTDVPGCYPI